MKDFRAILEKIYPGINDKWTLILQTNKHLTDLSLSAKKRRKKWHISLNAEQKDAALFALKWRWFKCQDWKLNAR